MNKAKAKNHSAKKKIKKQAKKELNSDSFSSISLQQSNKESIS